MALLAIWGNLQDIMRFIGSKLRQCLPIRRLLLAQTEINDD